jgi:hypothetical protein
MLLQPTRHNVAGLSKAWQGKVKVKVRGDSAVGKREEHGVSTIQEYQGVSRNNMKRARLSVMLLLYAVSR